MKLRESGMPDESYWETLFDVKLILDRLGIDDRTKHVVELGCGYGTFTLPLARRISGVLRTFDIDADMVNRTVRRAAAEGVSNIRSETRDVFLHGFGLAPNSQDACLLFNILHCEEPLQVLVEASRVVRPAGSIHVIHWRYDATTPRGPNMEIRPRPEQILEWGSKAPGLMLDADANQPMDCGPHPEAQQSMTVTVVDVRVMRVRMRQVRVPVPV
jgi:SAM-dependent methyltransferase